MRIPRRRPLLSGAATLFLLFTLATPLLHAHDLYICKASDSTPSLDGTLFMFDVSGGTIAGTMKVGVKPGQCIYVAQGPYLEYTITEEPSSGSILTNVTANPTTGLVMPWTGYPSRTVLVKVYTTNLYVTFTNTARVGLSGRFTGGGSIFTASGERVTHGFELHCNASITPNNLEINFGGNNFHLTSLTTSYCYINASGVAVIVGSGTGLYNGATGYSISFTLTDAGTPGTHDYAMYLITGPGDTTVLSAAGYLDSGNQDYHPN